VSALSYKFKMPNSDDDISDAQNKKQENSFIFEFGKRQRILELNPKSPLIEGKRFA
jgi:hypothetical protein